MDGDKPVELPPRKFEYLDHTADVQLHSWGDTLAEALEQVAMAMFGYISELDYIEMKESHVVEAEGSDLLSLLFHFLDEFLFLFSAEPNFIPRVVKVTELDVENFRVRAVGWGETFQIGKHPQGADVKAITYSSMQVLDAGEGWDIYVIVDVFLLNDVCVALEEKCRDSEILYALESLHELNTMTKLNPK